ncbi:MAG: TIGR01212 family radical SAM protein [Desulfovermiculus sp.]|nr:TIGR01212 family radical SAM protein [Desulfovermiculus sp.]
MQQKPYRDFNSYLRQRYGCRVQKISLDAGLTCPNRDGTLSRTGCIYCNPRGSGTGQAANGLSIAQQLENAKEPLRRRYKARKFLAYFQSYTNTYAPVDRLQDLYAQAVGDPDVVGLSIGTRPDCVPEQVLDLISEMSRQKDIWLEYGLQSAHEETLAGINRGHGVAAFADAVSRTRQRGLPVCVHVILGLPGEGEKEMLETARYLAEQDIQAVKIHLLYVVQGTALHRLYAQGKYRCLEQEEYADLAAKCVHNLPREVIIQRLTGDPHQEELVAPLWAVNKQQTLQMIEQRIRDQEE